MDNETKGYTLNADGHGRITSGPLAGLPLRLYECGSETELYQAQLLMLAGWTCLLSEPLQREEAQVALQAMFPATGTQETSDAIIRKARDTLASAQFWLTATTTEGQGVIGSIRSLIREIEAHLGLVDDDQVVMAE